MKKMPENSKESVFQPSEDEQIVFSGQRIEIVNQLHSLDGKEVMFEWGQRPPGVRILAINPEGEILLTREYRHEIDDYDYRLPGGKVADTLEEWHTQRESGTEQQAVEQKVVEEGKQEAGIEIQSAELIEVVPDGATFKWDLHYYETRDFVEGDQELEHGEDIETSWYSPDEVLELVKNKKIQEGRTVYILMPYVLG